MGRAKDLQAAATAGPETEVKAESVPVPPVDVVAVEPATDAAEADAEATPDPADTVPETSDAVPISDVASVNPFGKPMVIVHKKEDGGVGIPVSALQAKPIEPEYVEPESRSNPEYLAKLAVEKAEADAEQAKRDKAKRAFGFGTRGQVVGASPNSPQAKQNTFS